MIIFMYQSILLHKILIILSINQTFSDLETQNLNIRSINKTVLRKVQKISLKEI